LTNSIVYALSELVFKQEALINCIKENYCSTSIKLYLYVMYWTTFFVFY